MKYEDEKMTVIRLQYIISRNGLRIIRVGEDLIYGVCTLDS